MKKNREKNETASKQKSISCYFSAKNVEENNKRKRQQSDSEQVKQKLAAFKSAENEIQNQQHQEKKRKFSIDIDANELKDNNIEETNERKSGGESKGKLTPLESQVQVLKEAHPETLLMVECGYRYRFFGDDALKAAQILDITAHPDTVGSGLLGWTASVPTFNGHLNYVRKLVLNGHKVGIVTQTESSAEKKCQKNTKSGPFARQLTEVFTASTFLGEDLYDLKNRTFVIASIVQDCMLTLCPTLGRLCLTKLTKDALNHHEPFEIVTNVEQDTLNQYIDNQRLFRDNPVRLEIQELNDSCLETLVFDDENTDAELRQAWPSFGKNQVQCFQLMHQYLKQFSLENFIIHSTFMLEESEKLISNDLMKLPQMTIDGLELVHLLKIINVAKTKPGKRLLKVWTLNPITVQTELESRLDAVQYLLKYPQVFNQLRSILNKYHYDFETTLTSAAINQKISKDRFQLCLRTLMKIAQDLSALTVEESMPTMLKTMLDKLGLVWFQIPTDLLNPMDDKNETMEKLDAEMQDFLQKIEQHKLEISKILGLLSFSFTSVSGLDYLIEVKKGTSVPSTWRKINVTQKVDRYHSPFILDILPKLQWNREQLQQEIAKAWKQYLGSSVGKIKSLMRTVSIWAKLDVLVAFASIAQRYSVR